MKKSSDKKISVVQMILWAIVLFCVLSIAIFSYAVYKVNIVPGKYLVIGYAILILIILGSIIFIWKRPKSVSAVISSIVLIFISCGSLFITTYFNDTYHFFEGALTSKENQLTYSVIVLKSSKYTKLEDIKGKSLGYLKDENTKELLKTIVKQVSVEEKSYQEFGLLPDDLLSSKVDSIVIEESNYVLLKEEIKDFSEQIRVIATMKIKEQKQVPKDLVEVSKEPFILYISGIDQYGNVNTVRGRSDVNQLAVVNPKTNKILLVNTPRDYYVQLAGTTGLKDKLTHAGIYGIDKSIDTLESFYKIEISHYIRVNFNTLISVVDVIGGIDIYSDKAFRSYTNQTVYINQGWNHLNGTEALAYSRERKAYLTGDHHRGANQQQVLTAIIDKTTRSSVLISKYSSILKSLKGGFQTDMEMNQITDFLKYQLDKMPSWTIESIAVTGYNSNNYTYSMGRNYLLYVMEPDYSSVEKVKKRILEVLNES